MRKKVAKKEIKKAVATELELKIQMVENTVLIQNESIDRRLSGLEHVVKEVHDKLDKIHLEQAVILERLSGKVLSLEDDMEETIEYLEDKIAAVDSAVSKRFSNIWKTIVTVVTLFISAAGAYVSRKN